LGETLLCQNGGDALFTISFLLHLCGNRGWVQEFYYVHFLDPQNVIAFFGSWGSFSQGFSSREFMSLGFFSQGFSIWVFFIRWDFLSRDFLFFRKGFSSWEITSQGIF
jgi:hypothetical protein